MNASSAAQRVSSNHCATRLELVFARCFAERDNTALAGGYDEPLYKPASKAEQSHCLGYREDFFASALHEVAHWCIAGSNRRLQTDFGYWYTPDGRTEAQQKAFERVEYKPQALEWFFSVACGYPFQVSADNLHGVSDNRDAGKAFKLKVIQQANKWRRQGLPADAAIFFRALNQEFDTSPDLESLHFSLTASL
jgi:elongation factor P hydroxylase